MPTTMTTPISPNAQSGCIATGCEYVLITGTHENTPQVVNTLYGQEGIVRSDSWQRLPGNYHGSGCTLASAIAATIANGLSISGSRQGRAGIYLANTEGRVPSRHGPAHSRPPVLGARGRAGRRQWPQRGMSQPGKCRRTRKKTRDLRPLRGHARSSPIPRLLAARVRAALAGGARFVAVPQQDPPAPRCGVSRRRRCLRFAASMQRRSSSTTISIWQWRSMPTACISAARTDRIAAARAELGPTQADRRLLLQRAANSGGAPIAEGADYVAFGSFFASSVKPGRRARAARTCCAKRSSGYRCRSSPSAASRSANAPQLIAAGADASRSFPRCSRHPTSRLAAQRIHRLVR